MTIDQLKKYFIPILIIVFIVLTAVFVGDKFNMFGNAEYPDVITEVNNAYESGDYDKAIKTAEDASNEYTSISDTEKLALELKIANLYYNRGGTGDEDYSIDTQKKIALDTAIAPDIRTAAINNLASYYYEDRSQTTFNKIFSGEWASLAEGNDDKTALRKLSELSYSILPNIGALLRISYWYNSQLLDNANNITAKQKDEYIAKIKKNLDETEQIAIQQNAPKNWSKNSYASYLHRRAFSEATLALVTNDDKYKNLFQEGYDKVIKLRDEEISRLGSTKITETVPYTYFYHAAFLNRIYGSKQEEKVKDLVENIVTVVNENKNRLETRGFLIFVKEESSRTESQKDHNYSFFLELAKISPAFKELLIQNGWKI